MRVKICGITRKQDLREAVIAGASYIGFIFFENSPRNLTIDLARELALEAPVGMMKVGLLVDASDEFIAALLAQVPLDMLQLHGRETPQRVREVKARFGLPVMKAIGIADHEDMKRIADYDEVDQFLLDAKAPKNADLPGGNGVAFDWDLLKNFEIDKPWMLAGGLSPENVAEAIEKTGALQVDVSSGVESTPGIKDKELMTSFIQEAKRL